MTKFLLDSGDPNEYKEIQEIARKNNSEIWGATTNPTLIAKSASWRIPGKKFTQEEAFQLQKEIVLEIIDIVPGAVSAEVYADEKTTAQEMIKQGQEIAKWHRRVFVKLPTTIEGFKARTALRQENIQVNNTLVFSQEQVFAICLHEFIIQKNSGPTTDLYPPFISPFVGRLDDINIDGMSLVDNSMKIKNLFELGLPKTKLSIWMLEASVRTLEHVKQGIALQTELITAPFKVYKEWFSLSKSDQENFNITENTNLKPIDFWQAPQEFFSIDTIEKFMELITSNKLNIQHDLTDKGLIRFAEDWRAITI